MIRTDKHRVGVMKSDSFADFCAKVFLCRWDKAARNIVMLFSFSILTVHFGKSAGLLFSQATILNDVATALLVTAFAIALGYWRKRTSL